MRVSLALGWLVGTLMLCAILMTPAEDRWLPVTAWVTMTAVVMVFEPGKTRKTRKGDYEAKNGKAEN